VAETPNYFQDGAAYERTMGRWSQRAGSVFLDWLDPPKGLEWLDVGCGNGAFTETLIARAAPAEVVGIDPSEGQLAYARGRDGAKRAQFRIGNAQALPFADNRFEAASMALVITFVPDAAKAVAEMARVVRPGGPVATYMWDISGGGLPMERFYAAVRALGVAIPMPPGVGMETQDNFRRLWAEAGLAGIETRTIDIEVAYSDFDDFWQSNAGSVGPLAATFQQLPQQTKDGLQASLRAGLAPDRNGRIVFAARANAVKGRVPA
jgi:ubiquinone/menaquinone biosynthesis C-methylase UbiE